MIPYILEGDYLIETFYCTRLPAYLFRGALFAEHFLHEPINLAPVFPAQERPACHWMKAVSLFSEGH